METPTPYGFDLDPGEQITRVIHRSILDFLPIAILAVILFLAALALTFIDARFPGSFPFPPLLTLALIAVMVVLSAIIFLVGFTVYRRNVLIFTNVHLVQVTQNSLFSHQVSQINFDRVQDVSGTRTGFLQTVFNYGNVEIQSAGEQEKFIFTNAPDPQRIADDALEIHEQCLRNAHQPEPTE